MKWHNVIIIYLLVTSTSVLNAQLRVIDNGYVGIGDNQITPGSLLELTDNGWLRFNAPSGTSGILFYKSGTSTPTNVQYGGKIFYDGSSDLLRIGTMQNNSYRQAINIRRSDGNVGIKGSASNEALRVHGHTRIFGGLNAEYVTLSNDAYVGSNLVTNFLNVIGATDYQPLVNISGQTQGFHLYVTGRTYSSLGYQQSDLSSKKNVINLDGNQMLSKLMKLDGHMYEFKSASELEPLYNNGTFNSINDTMMLIPDLPKGQHYGLIAQEVEKEFPELIFKDPVTNIMAINYSGMIPVLLEALKEQQKIITSYEDRLGNLESKLEIKSIENELKSTFDNQDETASADDDILQNTALYQNSPNPFNQVTTIRFVIPESVDQAMLYIYNMQGMQIKSHQINDRGHSTLEIQGAVLKPGMYLYTLIVDGRAIDTKRMILTD